MNAKSLEEALEQTLSGFPIEQFTFIAITRKEKIIKSAFECLEDKDLRSRVTVKFTGEEAVHSGRVTRELFSELFLGFSVCSILVRGAYPNVTFRHNLEALSKGLFELFGKFVTIALVNGCPGFHFLTPMHCSRVLFRHPS